MAAYSDEQQHQQAAAGGPYSVVYKGRPEGPTAADAVERGLGVFALHADDAAPAAATLKGSAKASEEGHERLQRLLDSSQDVATEGETFSSAAAALRQQTEVGLLPSAC
ncbi:hypothetical protein Esti_005638 [Eimeria stiedai]